MKLLVLVFGFISLAASADIVDQTIRGIEVKRRVSCREMDVTMSSGCKVDEFSIKAMLESFFKRPKIEMPKQTCTEVHRYQCSNGQSAFNLILDVRVDDFGAMTIQRTQESRLHGE